MPRSSPTRVRVALLAAGVVAATVVGPGVGAAAASGAVQQALCVGHAPGPCQVSTGQSFVASDQLLRASVSGNAGVQVELQFYAVEFNSAGQVTRLVPSGEPVTGTTARSGTQIVLVPRTVPDLPGGWGFIGLADDDSIDLRTRLGQLVEFSSRHIRLLGDGYAEQKPMGVELDMHVLGHVTGARYWVEYLADDGTWTPVPGQGYTAAQRLRTSPGEREHLTYTVPETLTPGRAYTFRVNTHLNYDGGSDRMVADPVFAEWLVVPVEEGKAKERAGDLDAGKGPGLPDPSPSDEDGAGGDGAGGDDDAPGGAGGSSEDEGEATPVPDIGASADPTAPDPTAPDPMASNPTASNPTAPGAAAPSTATPDIPSTSDGRAPREQESTPEAGDSSLPPEEPSSGPTGGADASGAPTSASPSATGAGAVPAPTSGAGDAVWGEEARTVAAPRAGEAPTPLRWGLAWLLALVLAGPLGWPLVRRRVKATTEDVW